MLARLGGRRRRGKLKPPEAAQFMLVERIDYAGGM